MSKQNKLNEKAKDAVARYLVMKDYEILERDWNHGHDSIDFIARDGDSLVFVRVDANVYGGGAFDELEMKENRESFERLALAYLMTAEHVNINVRMDVMSVMILNESRAMIKHCVNAVS